MLGNGLAHGMYNPMAVWSSDTGLHCDGVNDYKLYTIPASAAATSLVNSFTISMWVKTPLYYGIVGGDPNAGIFNLRSGVGKVGHRLQVSWIDGTAGGVNQIQISRTTNDESATVMVSATMNTAGWNSGFHLVVTVSPTALIGYVNGVAATTSNPGPSDSWTDPQAVGWNMFFGALNNDNGFHSFAESTTHDINIWSDIKTPAEIVDIYNLNEPKDETNNLPNLYLTKDSNNDYEGGTGDAIIIGYEPN